MASGTVEKSVANLPIAGRYLLGVGAYDLAGRVRTELERIEPIRALLARHLTEAEKTKLRLGRTG